MSGVTDFRKSSAKIIIGTASDALSIGGVTISSNAAAGSGLILVATGSNSAIWRDALSFGSNANDVGAVSTMGSSPSNTRADHVHRGVSSLAHTSNTLYGGVTVAAGPGIALTIAGQTMTITGSATIVSGTYVEAKNGGSEVVATSSVTGTHTINLANGNWHDVTMTGNTTFSFTGATSGEGDSFVLILRQDGTGGRDATFPGAVVWPGTSEPTADTTASSVSIYTFLSRDGGTTWFGFLAGGGAAIASPSFASNTFSEVALTVDASMALTAPTATSLLFSSPFFSEVVVDSSGNIVYEGVDIVHSLVRLY